MPALAKIDTTELPVQFSYKPYVPHKRITTHATYKAVVVQSASPDYIVDGEDFIEWVVEGGTVQDWHYFASLYDTTSPTNYTFTGYWGEVLVVQFPKLEPPVVKGRMFTIRGTFQVMDVTTFYSNSCSV